MQVSLLLTLFFAPAVAQFPLPDDFAPAVTSAPWAFIVQPDGKILVAGYSTMYPADSTRRLARIYSDGTTDPHFSIENTGLIGPMLLLPDGALLVAGSFTWSSGESTHTSIARLSPTGSPDPEFAPVLANNSMTGPIVHALALQQDGKILVGGQIRGINGHTRVGLGRIHQDGLLDVTFQPQLSGQVHALAIQNDGKILVGGWFGVGGESYENLVRLNTDGSIDSAFSASIGKLYGRIQALAIQPDGRILIGGSQYDQPLTDSVIARLNPDGTEDMSFLASSTGSWLNALVLQADGRILVSGFFGTLSGEPRSSLGRLNPDGTADPAFYPQIPLQSSFRSLAIQPDGKALVAGYTNLVRLGTTSPSGQQLSYSNSTITWLRFGSTPEVMRTTFEFSADGDTWALLGEGARLEAVPQGEPGGWKLETSAPLENEGTIRARGYLSGGGHAWGNFVEQMVGVPIILDHPLGHSANAQSSTFFRVIVAGSEPWHFQWRKNGEPLAEGPNISGANGPMLTLNNVLDPDEGAYDVLVISSFGVTTSRLANLSVVDPFVSGHPLSAQRAVGESATFSVEVRGTPPFSYQWFHNGTELPGATESSLTLTNVQPGQAGPYHVVVSNAFSSAVSESANLTVNTIYWNDSFQISRLSQPTLCALQADRKILVAGYDWQNSSALGRFSVDGILDSSFHPEIGNRPVALIVQEDGKLLLHGNFSALPGSPSILRLNQDGTFDEIFTPPIFSQGSVSSILVQPDHTILVGGTFERVGQQFHSRLVRLHSDGTLDPTYNPEFRAGFRMALQPDGKLLVTAGGSVARLHPDGSADPEFHLDTDFDGTIDSILLYPDGRILLAIKSPLSSRPHHSFLVRLDPGGELDPFFHCEANGDMHSLALQVDGSIIALGAFTEFAGEPRQFIARVLADGAPDLSFNPGLQEETRNFMLQPDGHLLLTRQIRLSAIQTARFISRLLNNVPASDDLSVTSSAISWRRIGSGPEVSSAFFEHSNDGITWTRLGSGTWLPPSESELARWELSGISLPEGGSFRVRGYTSSGWNNAAHWSVDVYSGVPVLFEQPVGATNNAATAVTISVLAAGGEPLQYQWFHNGAPLTDNATTSGSNARALILNSLLKANEGDYHVVVSNADGEIASETVRLSVMDPLITLHPLGQNKDPGQEVTLTVTAVGTDLSYQWFKDGSPLPGANSSTLVLTNLQPRDAGAYTVTVAAPHQTLATDPAILSVNLSSVDLDFYPPRHDPLYTLAVQRDGKILLAEGGVQGDLMRVQRLHPNGAPDEQFRVFARTPLTTMALLPEDKIAFADLWLGQSGSFNVTRIHLNGAYDSTFSNPTPDGRVQTVLAQPDGRILVGGGFRTIAGQPKSRLARLNVDGSLDLAFPIGGCGRGQ